MRSMSPDDRAVSPVFGYTLTLAVATLLIGGLIITAGSFVDTQREVTAEGELDVIGQQVSADIAAADRLARTDGTDEVAVGRTLPDRVVGSQYRIEVVDDGEGPTSPYLELSTTSPSTTVRVGIATKHDVRVGASVGGGDIEVVYDEASGEVVLRAA